MRSLRVSRPAVLLAVSGMRQMGNVFTATLDKYIGGQCISCAYMGPTLVGNDGQITITFTSPTTATVNLPGGRHIGIQRYFQP